MFRTQDVQQFQILYDRTRAIGKKIEADYKSLGNCTADETKRLKLAKNGILNIQKSINENKEVFQKAFQKCEGCFDDTEMQLTVINAINLFSESIYKTLEGKQMPVVDTKVDSKNEFPSPKVLNSVSQSLTNMSQRIEEVSNLIYDARKEKDAKNDPGFFKSATLAVLAQSTQVKIINPINKSAEKEKEIQAIAQANSFQLAEFESSAYTESGKISEEALKRTFDELTPDLPKKGGSVQSESLTESLNDLAKTYQQASEKAQMSLEFVECSKVQKYEDELKKLEIINTQILLDTKNASPQNKSWLSRLGVNKPADKTDCQFCYDFQMAILQPLGNLVSVVAKASDILSATRGLYSEYDKDASTEKCVQPNLKQKNTELLQWIVTSLKSIDVRLKKAEEKSLEELNNFDMGLIRNATEILRRAKEINVSATQKFKVPKTTAVVPKVAPPAQPKPQSKQNKQKQKNAGSRTKTEADAKINIETFNSAKRLVTQKKVDEQTIQSINELDAAIAKEEAWLIVNSGPTLPVLGPRRCWLKSVLDDAQSK